MNFARVSAASGLGAMTYTLENLPETPAERERVMAMDLLSEALTLMRLTGALIFRVDLRGPWGVSSPPKVERFAQMLPVGTTHVIAFHVVLQGACWIRRPPDEWLEVTAGQAVVFAQGDVHELADRPGRKGLPFTQMLGRRALPDLRHLRFDNGAGDTTNLLCGFLGCDRRAFEPLCHSLPPLLVVNPDPRLDALVHYAVADALDDSPGAAGLRGRLAELLFLGALRLYLQHLPADATGWLAGLRDPPVSRALHAMHAQPARDWSVATLARVSASSRSALAARFRELIGEPPMHYLTRLRMRLAAQRLSDSRRSVESVAEEVGYDSSAAFQRAFKRHFEQPPAAWRRQIRE